MDTFSYCEKPTFLWNFITLNSAEDNYRCIVNVSLVMIAAFHNCWRLDISETILGSRR